MSSLANNVDDSKHQTRDRIAVAIFVVVEIAMVITVASRRNDLDGLQRAVLFGLTPLLPLPLLMRRRYPGQVLTVLAVMTAAIWLSDVDVTTAVTGAIGLYSLGRFEDSKRSLRWWLITLAILVPAGLISALIYRGNEMWYEFVSRCGVLLGFYWLGVSFRSRAEVTDALRARALRAEQDAHEQRERAVLAERTRIAAEMHDVISHSVTVMVVQSDVASRLVEADPAAARRSMEHVSVTGRAALSELRSMLQVLGTTGSSGESGNSPVDLQPQPNATAIPSLVESFRSAGLIVDVDVQAETPLDAFAESISRCAYRIIQEAITNAMKRAPGARVGVTLAEEGEHLTIAVTNTPGVESLETQPATQSAGFGLIGMAERVKAVEGHLRHGRTASGGYEVLARLPMHRVAQ